MQILSKEVHDALIVPGYITLHPYVKGNSNDNTRVFTSVERISEDGKCKFAGHYSTEFNEELRKEMSEKYTAGSIHMHISQLKKGEPWLVSIKADNILASWYFKVESDEVLKLIANADAAASS